MNCATEGYPATRWYLPCGPQPPPGVTYARASTVAESISDQADLANDSRNGHNNWQGGIAEGRVDPVSGFRRFFVPPGSIAVYEFTYYRYLSIVTIRLKQNF